MFTGIIQACVPISESRREKNSCLHVQIKKPSRWKLKKGESVSVDGICSTVIAFGKDFFKVEYMPETLSKTTAASFGKGRRVNLERSLKLSDTLDGNIVQGHVDGTASVQAVETDGESRLVWISMSREMRRFIAPQGSVVVNGVSLTVAGVKSGKFMVALIPYTLSHTNLDDLKKGDLVNIEIDVLARYVVNAIGKERFKKVN